MKSVRDLGCKTNLEVIDQFVSLTGQRVIDVGCGSMEFTRHLSDLGAHVLAIDPDPVQAVLNRTTAAIPSVEFIEAGAEELPVASQTIDGVFFSYSLHHIPQEFYPRVFDEVLRALVPDGFLFVIEPTDCAINDVMKLFQNEDQERAAAQRALEEMAIPAFQSVDIVSYYSIAQYASFEKFAEQFGTHSFTSYSKADVQIADVRAAFERLGGSDHRFKSTKQVMFLKGLSATG